MALAVADAPTGTDLAGYAEPRLTGPQRELLDAVFWLEACAGRAPTAQQVAAEHGWPTSATRGRLDSSTRAGLLVRWQPEPQMAHRYALTGTGRVGLALADVVPVECPRCGVEVLLADVGWRLAVLEPPEVLEQFGCPQLAAAQYTLGDARMVGSHSGHCLRCGGSGTVGEPLPRAGVAVDQHGRGRWFRAGGGRGPGEAVYAEHVCVVR